MAKKEEEKKSAPIFHLRNGGLELACWENKSRDGKVTFNTFSFKRSYKTDDGKWEETSSLRVRDLLVFAEMLRQAFVKVSTKEDSEDED